MAKKLKVVFKRVNGDKTGYFTRRGPGKKYPSDGIHYMKNCTDGQTFYCDVEDAGNGYHILHNPEANGINTYGNPCYAWLNSGHCSWIEVDDTPAPAPTPVQEEPIQSNTQVEYKPAPALNNTFKNLFGEDELDASKVWGSGSGITTSTKTINLNSTANIPTSFFNDYSDFVDNMSIIRKNLNINDSASNLADIKYNMVNRFDRWKVAHPDIQLTKSFGYVFFTRPALNLYDHVSYTEIKLLDVVSRDPVYYYLDNNNRQLLRSLTKTFSGMHDFNPFLSNMAQSFELSDESIETIEHGKTFTGHMVKYGRHNIKSKTAGTFSVDYIDDNEYKVYKIHKAWCDYISKVYRGEFEPEEYYIKNRILDYACSVYYFLCGEDGETILFWSKYTGVFPTNIPSAKSSWNKGTLLKMPEISVNYEYAWKEDFNPVSLAEFNINGSGADQDSGYSYISTYEPELLTTGKTFTGSPFVETIRNSVGDYTFKLRFRAPK